METKIQYESILSSFVLRISLRIVQTKGTHNIQQKNKRILVSHFAIFLSKGPWILYHEKDMVKNCDPGGEPWIKII